MSTIFVFLFISNPDNQSTLKIITVTTKNNIDLFNLIIVLLLLYVLISCIEKFTGSVYKSSSIFT